MGRREPSPETRPRRAGNSLLPAARFGPPAWQIPGALCPPANRAVDAPCNRFAMIQSSAAHGVTTRTPAHSNILRPTEHKIHLD